MAYPRRYKTFLQQDSKLAAFLRFMWEQDFLDTDISFEPWYLTKGEHLEYPPDWKNWKSSLPLKVPLSTSKVEGETQKDVSSIVETTQNKKVIAKFLVVCPVGNNIMKIRGYQVNFISDKSNLGKREKNKYYVEKQILCSLGICKLV